MTMEARATSSSPTPTALSVTTFGAFNPSYELRPTSAAFAGQWIKLGSYPGAVNEWHILGGVGKWETNVIPA